MMSSKTQLLLFVSMAIVAAGHAGKYTGDKVLRIFPVTDLQVDSLLNLEQTEPFKYDFWQYSRGRDKTVDIHIKENNYKSFTKFLSSKNMTYRILVEDLQTLMDHENDGPRLEDAAANATDSWYKKYHPYDEIMVKLTKLSSNADGRVKATVSSIGKSIEGRELLAVEITSSFGQDKPVIAMTCGIHAREWVGPATCLYMIDKLINEYGKDATITNTLDKMDFIVVPMVNPDGYVFSWTNKRLWRKNRRRTNKHCIGVDLNRNFAYKWGQKLSKSAASPFPCSDIYAGNSAESEPEVHNVANFLRGLNTKRVLKSYLDIHSYSQMWLLPWGFTEEPSRDFKEQWRVATIANDELFRYNGTEYKIGSSSKLLYVNSGTSKDFAYGELNVPYTYVLELRDKGQFGFVLPAHQILDTAKETFGAIKALVGAINLDYSPKILRSKIDSLP